MTQEGTNKVLNLIRNPPTDESYRHIKDRLLRIFSLNDYARAEAIANMPLTSNMQSSTLQDAWSST